MKFTSYYVKDKDLSRENMKFASEKTESQPFVRLAYFGKKAHRIEQNGRFMCLFRRDFFEKGEEKRDD